MEKKPIIPTIIYKFISAFNKEIMKVATVCQGLCEAWDIP